MQSMVLNCQSPLPLSMRRVRSGHLKFFRFVVFLKGVLFQGSGGWYARIGIRYGLSLEDGTCIWLFFLLFVEWSLGT